MNTDRISGIKWLPFGLLFAGLVAKWLHFDAQGILLNIGFISFGLVTLFDCIKAKYHRQLNLDTVQIVLSLVIIVLALENMLTSEQNFKLFGVAILFQYLIGQRRRFNLKSE